MPSSDRRAREPSGRGPSRRRRSIAELLRPRLATLGVALVVLGLGAIGAFAGAGAPTVETEHATAVGRTSVMLNASVNPNGSAVSECYFEYGTSESSLSSTAECSYSPGALETPVAVHATVEALSETSHYFFRIHAKSAEGESSGAIRGVTTLPKAPTSITERPVAVGHTGAILSASVTPNDSLVTECFFEYGTNPEELTSQATCSPPPGEGGEPVTVTAPLSGLPERAVFYYRIVAHNSFGTSTGEELSLETLPSPPKADTAAIASVTGSSVILRGLVTPDASTVESCHFEWGTASVEEHTAPCEPAEIGSGEVPVMVSATLTGLAETTTYQYRLVASNGFGTGTGAVFSFTTFPTVPKAGIQTPRGLSDETAMLRGRINPQGDAVTECRFEYGTTPALGKAASCNTLPPAGETFVPVSATVSGLSPTTTYLVRVRAVNSHGVVYSREQSFTTYEPGLLPSITKLSPRKGSSAGGTIVTITGENLLHATAVTFGETETTEITSNLANSITVVAPPGLATVDVIVTTLNGQSAVVPADHFTYGRPIITEVSPNHGPTGGGTIVTVTGTGFETGNTGTTFTVGKATAASVECTSSTSCTVVTPPSFNGKVRSVAVRATVNGKRSPSSTATVFSYE